MGKCLITFAEVYDLSCQKGWTSNEHFTADGTRIEAWASLISFVRTDGAGAAQIRSAKDENPGNPIIHFRGEKRCNNTHQSTTDLESVLYRKANGKGFRLCYGKRIDSERKLPRAGWNSWRKPYVDSERVLPSYAHPNESKKHDR